MQIPWSWTRRTARRTARREAGARARRPILVAVLVLALAVGACSFPPPTVTKVPVQLVPSVQAHTASLMVAAGQTGSATAVCGSGEFLVSGGYAFTDELVNLDVSDLNLSNYPSDANGAAATAQGQTEPGWTVHLTNPVSSMQTLHMTVVADCLSGVTGASGVWSAADWAASKADIEAGCPDPNFNVLTGGGWGVAGTPNGYVIDAYPAQDQGAFHKVWHVISGGDNQPPAPPVATAYAVCAKGLFNEPLVQGDADWEIQPSNPPDTLDHLQLHGFIGCPAGEIVSGGGTQTDNNDIPTILSVASPSPGSLAWFVQEVRAVSVDAPWLPWLMQNPPSTAITGICVSATQPKLTVLPPPHIYAAIPNWPLLIIPEVPAGTSGAPIALTERTGRVSQVHSAPIAAPSSFSPTGSPLYTVPANCGNPAPAVAAATAALQQQLTTLVPAGQLKAGTPSFNVDTRTLTCSPAAGTQASAPFTYTQAVDGSVTQDTVNPSDVLTYQQRQLELAAQKLGSGYRVRERYICPQGVTVVSASATRATLSCPTNGRGVLVLTADQTAQLIRLVAGKSVADAQAILRQQSGLAQAVLTVDPPGTTTLPSDPSEITLTLVGEDIAG